MGTPLPRNPPGEPGDVCWGLGKPFGDGPTPAIIEVHFVNWREDVNFDESFRDFLTTPHSLYQDSNPNQYIATNDVWSWFLAFQELQTNLFLVLLDGFETQFDGVGAAVCETQFPNLIDFPGSHIVWGGFASISWSEVFG